MKYFFDTEFIEDGKTIDLISIGIVADDGREYYAINCECDWSKASDWVRKNVLDTLNADPQPQYTVKRKDIAREVLAFCDSKEYGRPEFWGYYADYDWVVFCQLWGTMMNLPKEFPKYCRDIKQLCDSLGNPKLPEQGKGEHHALADARWNRSAWEYLQALSL